ncbi:hypothetical protein [Aeromicrobium sp. HA]|uniref:hypothetical protein n=1 Tax=Aeromicrobium sp. HA TaxID=3009077 RepID=UPI0022B0381A|nr:hypothetical protein [Aeromicrobium sp. HA]
MNIKEARAAIEAILAAIPDEEFPDFDKVEVRKDGTEVVVWWGGRGQHLGSAKSNGVRNPLNYRTSASWNAIEGEMTYRADRRYLENGDTIEGIRLGRKTVEV